MLKEIYDYGVRANIASPVGFKYKNVKAYISLSSKGEFIAIEAAPNEKQLCPDIGSMANGREKSNIIVEKAEIVFGLTEKGRAKTPFYLNALEQGSAYDPLFQICLNALQNEEMRLTMITQFYEKKYKNGDPIGFKIDNFQLEKSADYQVWWKTFRRELQNNDHGCSTRLCFITGEQCEPLTTVSKFTGLLAVGGHTAGDSLICFDKPAFTSYNLDQAENCAVSEEAMTTVNFTLERLLKESPILAGTIFAHWYKEPLPSDRNYDPLSCVIKPIISEDEEVEDDVENSNENLHQSEIIALRNAEQLIESIKKGEYPHLLNNRYYILSLSGANGRVMIRSYMEGSYETLFYNIKAWFDDLTLINSKNPPKFNGILSRLLKYQKNNVDIGKRMAKELPVVKVQLLTSAVDNTPLPDSVAAKALAYIRSDLLNSDDDLKSNKITLDALACRILKAWLTRREVFYKGIKKEDVSVKEALNEQNCSSAYLAGRMMAAYAKIQLEALGDVGAGVVQHYYTSASTSPALVIGRLSGLSQHHLGKLDKGASIYYSKILADIASKVEDGFPKTLTLEQQSLFALGYYQQMAEFYKKRQVSETNNNDNSTEEENYVIK